MNIHYSHTLPDDFSCLITLLIDEGGIENFKKKYAHLIVSSLVQKYLKSHGDSFVHFSENGKPEIFVFLTTNNPFNDVVKSIRSALIKQKSILSEKLSGRIFCSEDDNLRKLFSELAMAVTQITNKLNIFKTGANGSIIINTLEIVHETGTDLESSVSVATEIAEVQLQAMRLVNLPANHKTPSMIADIVRESGEKYGYSVKLWDRQALEKEGFGALLSVSRGSNEEPRFLLLEYDGKPAAEQKTIGLVGKGVTFDTGGVSIKPSNNLYLMKSDMAGAAVMLSFVELAARLKIKSRVIAAIPLTENCVDGASTKPGDVITSYSGKTIEVIDTDAEGRLILSDALAYITTNFKTDYLIDMATLTGSVIHSLGNGAAGLFTNNDDLADALYSAGIQSGERCWRLPCWNIYLEEMKSDIADIKNLSTRQGAGAVTAAMFLSEFTGKHPAWAHLDIAGMAFGENEYGSMRSSTAYGLRLLHEFVMTNCE